MKLLKFVVLLSAVVFAFACKGSDDGEQTEGPVSVPSGVRVVESTTTSLTFGWEPVNGARNYAWKLLTERGELKQQSFTSECTVTVDGLTAGVTYLFCVSARGEQSNSEYSEPVAGTTSVGGGGSNPVPETDFGFPAHENDGLVRAFPGAEGGGMFVTGGRGGTVYHVTNLNDSGMGSLRYAVERSGARTIVFDVDGIIELKSDLEIKNGDLTIAGQTAPGDGICLKNFPLVVKTHNVIIRFIRCRMGNEGRDSSGNPVENDAMWGRFQKDIIIDHCSMSWSTDECASFYANENFTMQWCLIAESLRNSAHFKGSHGYGAIWGGVNASFHHNMLAHHESRNPRFDGGDVYVPKNTQLTSDQRAVDFRNCVVYNFSNYTAYGGEGQKVNYVGNYYKWGPASENGPGISYKDQNGVQVSSPNAPKRRQWFYTIQGIKEGVDYGCPSIYIGDNTNYFTPDNSGLNSDNWVGFVYDQNNQGQTEFTKLTAPVSIKPDGKTAYVTTHPVATAYERVLTYVGASLKRDAVDTRVTGDVRSGTATCMEGSNGSINGIIDSQADVGGWPTYASGTAAADSDGDGIPDEWEDKYGLDRASASDGNAKTLDPTGRYTNLEVYLHWLVKDIVNGQCDGGSYTSLE